MKKALITASVFGFVGSFEKNNIKILLDQGYQVHVATNMSQDLKAFGDTGQLDGFDVIKYQISYSRSPFSLETIKAYKEIKKLIQKEKFDLIHCHTPVAAMLARLGARKTREKGTKVIYTAHGFHFFKGAPLLNWLIYFPIEWICSFFTDILITINQEDYQSAQKFMKAKKIEYIAGIGIDVEKFKNSQVDKRVKREELGIPEDGLMLLSVGELIPRKNHQLVLRSLEKLRNNNINYCIVGQGPLQEELRTLVDCLGLSECVHFLGFRNDVMEICKVADIFVFPSLQEGLPVALMEAMASGLPVICSDIRGNKDLIKYSECRFNVKSIDDLHRKINKLIKSQEERNILKEYNLKEIDRFSVNIVMDKMKQIYEDRVE